MPYFGSKSNMRLSSCHPDLQELFRKVVKHFDCAVLCGYRNEATQTTAFEKGASKAEWPMSFHNQTPSLAIDVMPYPIDWKDFKRMYMFVGYVMATAKCMGIDVRSGADWNGDTEVKDNNFNDLPHFELIP